MAEKQFPHIPMTAQCLGQCGGEAERWIEHASLIVYFKATKDFMAKFFYASTLLFLRFYYLGT